MKIFDFFKKKNEEIIDEELNNKTFKKDFRNLIDITKILTDNNIEVIEDIKLMVDDHDNFSNKYKTWIENMDFSFEDTDEEKLLIFPYFIIGYDTKYKYGSYIDWKEEPEEIVEQLKITVDKLNYDIDLRKVEIIFEEDTDEFLERLNNYLKTINYTLVTLDTDSDSYHLFIAKEKDFDKLVELGKSIDIKFYNKYI